MNKITQTNIQSEVHGIRVDIKTSYQFHIDFLIRHIEGCRKKQREQLGKKAQDVKTKLSEILALLDEIDEA